MCRSLASAALVDPRFALPEWLSSSRRLKRSLTTFLHQRVSVGRYFALVSSEDCRSAVNAIMLSLLKQFVRGESGATAIEYGLIAGLIGIVIVGVLTTTGTRLTTKFTSVRNGLN